MPPTTFPVKRMFRPHVWLIASLAMVLFAGVIAGTLWPGRATRFFSVCGTAVAIASWILSTAMVTERNGTLTFVDGAVRASWRGASLRPTEVHIGRWVQTSLNTPVGLVAHLREPFGALRIGARDPLRGAYRLDGPRVQFVDCHLPALEFETLVQMLGLHPVVEPAPLAIELVARRRILRTLAPLMIAVACGAGAGIGLSALGLPQAVVVIPILGCLIGGIVATVLDAWRIREPEHELRVGADGIALAGVGGGPMRVRVPWHDVRAMATTGIVRGKGRRTFIYPTMELSLGSERPLVVGAWDPTLGWTNQTTLPRRAAHWLAGSADWHRLVATLGAHRCFR